MKIKATVVPGEITVNIIDFTLRDYFAGQAMMALVGCPLPAKVSGEIIKSDVGISKLAYQFADAMLKAREIV